MASRRASLEKMDIEDQAVCKEIAIEHRSNGTHPMLNEDDATFLATFPADKKTKLLRKVDWHLVPMLLFLYLITYIDKVNIGNAKIEGLLPDLHMSGYQYNIALSIFFIPYILAEVPSNMILQYLPRPSYYLGAIVFIWASTPFGLGCDNC